MHSVQLCFGEGQPLVVSLHPDEHFVWSEFLLPSGTRATAAAAASTE